MNYAKRLILLVAICSLLSGCASWVVRPQKVVLLPEERIFTVPAGQTIDVMLDSKAINMTFPEDMKLVSPTVLVRQETRLNNALLDKVKANKDKVATMGIVGSILAILAAGLGIFFKFKKWGLPVVKANLEVK